MKRLGLLGEPKTSWRYKNGIPEFFIRHYSHETKEYTEEIVKCVEYEQWIVGRFFGIGPENFVGICPKCLFDDRRCDCTKKR